MIISILVRVLETVFLLGLVGSGIVLILTSIEDIKELLPGNHEAEHQTGEGSAGGVQHRASQATRP